MNDSHRSLALAHQRADKALQNKNQKILKDIFVKYHIPKFNNTSNIDAQNDLINKENNFSYDELRNTQIRSIDYNIELGLASINLTIGLLANWQKYYELTNQNYNERLDKLL